MSAPKKDAAPVRLDYPAALDLLYRAQQQIYAKPFRSPADRQRLRDIASLIADLDDTRRRKRAQQRGVGAIGPALSITGNYEGS